MPHVADSLASASTVGQTPPNPDLDSGQQTENAGGVDENLKWIIISVVIGVLIVASVGLYFIITRARARKYMDACRRDPTLSRKEFIRVRKLSNAERVEEQETQREVMIRKSLATRSTASSMSSMMSRYSNIPHDMDEEEEIDLNDDRPRGLREDWKEFEARINRERSNSGELHPCIGGTGSIEGQGQGAGGVSTTTTNSRTVSPGRSPYLQSHPSPTFVTPQFQLHPLAPPPGLHPALAAMQRDRERESPSGLASLQPVHVARI